MKTMLPNNQKNCSFFKAVLVLISFINANAIANNNSDLSTSKVPPILSAKIFSKNAKHARTNLSTVETRKIKAAASVNNLITESTNSTNTTNPAVALDFDGVNDRAIISPVNNMNFSKLTIETWIKSTRNDPAAVEFICSGQNESLEIHLSPNGGLRFIPRPGLYLDAPINTIPQNTWFHLACVYDPVLGGAQIFINGTEVSVNNASGGSMYTAIPAVTARFDIGVRNANGDFPFKGQLDEFRVWSKALTEAEIQRSMSCGVVPQAIGLVANLRFNQGFENQNNSTVTVAQDDTGNGNNATLVNFLLNGLNSNWVAPGGLSATASLIIPTFTQVAPICYPATLAALPTTSNNGIIGSWSPALNNDATTTYIFTPAAGSPQCVADAAMTIVVNKVVPTFTSIAPICALENIAALPTTSNNGISGTWTPSLNNQATTVYAFTPAAGQCATTTTSTITIKPLPSVSISASPATGCQGSNVTLNGSSNVAVNGLTGFMAPANWTFVGATALETVSVNAPNSFLLTQTCNANTQYRELTYSIRAPLSGNLSFDWKTVNACCGGSSNKSLRLNGANVAINGLVNFSQTPEQTGTMAIAVNAGDVLSFAVALKNDVYNVGYFDTLEISNLVFAGGTLAWTTNDGTLVGPTNTSTAVAASPGTYTLTATTNNGCALSRSIVVSFLAPVTPTFTQIAPICSGTTLIALPTTSTNGIAGTWSPALNNLVTTTYTFTPNAGLCATTATLTIVVNPSSDNSTTISACTNYVWANTGQTYTQSGVYAGTTTNCVTQKLNLTINTIPVLPTLEQVSCGVGTVTFTSTASGVISWYSSATSTTILATGSSFTTPVLNGSTVYYYQVVRGSCTSARTPANAIVTPLPEILEVVNASACVPSSLTLEAISNDTAVKWYDAAVGGNLIYEGADFTTPFLLTTTIYYASAVSLYDCPPSARASVTATINNISAPTAASNQTFCSGETLANIAVTGTGIVWYDAATAGTILLSTTSIQSGTTYYASQTANGCENIVRKAITMTNGACLGNENFDVSTFSYYPNPTTGKVYFSYAQAIEKISVSNVLGQVILENLNNSNQAEIDLAGFAGGTYFVKLTSDNQIKTIKILKN